MRLCRFNDDRIGVVKDGVIVDVTAIVDELPGFRYPAPAFDLLMDRLKSLQPRIEEIARRAETTIPISSARLLSPVANPGKIVAAPVNYRRHLDEARSDPEIHFQQQISEINKLGLFLKAPSSVIGPGQTVAIRFPDRRNDHEVELAVVIGKRADRVAASRALDYVAGYCIGLDMTVRGTEDRSFRKSIDTFTVLGPWLSTPDEVADPEAVDLSLKVNGELRQSSNTRDLIVGVKQLIAWASAFYTLMPGDVLMTGTPDGVGPVSPGDTIHAVVEGVGSMDVQVGAVEPARQ